MTRGAWRLVAVAGALTASAADAPRDLSTLFPSQAPIFVEGRGVARLVLPAEVLGGCRADLSDLRVFDREGREVAFLVDSGLAPGRRLEATESLTPDVLAVDRRRIDRDSGPSLWQESYEILAPEEAPTSGRWDLVLDVRRPSFVRRVDVVEIATGSARNELVVGASVFRLRDPLRERLEIALPEQARGRLAITLVGEDGPYLEPVIRFESSREIAAGERASVPLDELGRQRVDGSTVIELARPRGLVPDLLVVDTSTAAFNRRVEVWDEGPGAVDQALGGGVLFRVTTLATVEETSLAVAPPRGDRLRVIIADGDSPPLADIAVRGVVRRPALLFALPESPGNEPSGVLRFGGRRAFRPHYDLASLPGLSGGPAGEPSGTLLDPTLLAVARLGPPEANPAFDAAPALAFAQRAGAELDRRPFSHRRRLRVTPSAEGLSRLVLQPEDTALLRPDLGDLRIVDEGSRQWAYLLEERATVESRELAVFGRHTERGISRYALALPVAPAVLDQVAIDPHEPFFDRGFQLGAALDERHQRTTTLARGRLVRRVGDPRPVIVEVPAVAVHTLELRIEDGDDSPLELESVGARLPLPEVFFAAPAGEYDLLLGQPEAAGPRYELSRIRSVVLAVASAETGVGPLTANPDYKPGARLADRRGLLQVALWVVIVALVVFLTVLTLRLARAEP